MSHFEPPQRPQDFHSWSTADTSAYNTFIEALQEVVERNVVITEEMANEMNVLFTHITYLGTNPIARNQ
jgi:5-methylcytosine-specific restriction endonuclease McrBC regulatory subunit McrC